MLIQQMQLKRSRSNEEVEDRRGDSSIDGRICDFLDDNRERLELPDVAVELGSSVRKEDDKRHTCRGKTLSSSKHKKEAKQNRREIGYPCHKRQASRAAR